MTVGYAAGLTVYKYSTAPPPVSPLRAAPPTRYLDSNEPLVTTRPVQIPLEVPAEASRLAVGVWERFGDRVRQLVDESQPPAGSRTVIWDMTDDAGQPLEAGDFLLRVTVDGRSESRILSVT